MIKLVVEDKVRCAGRLTYMPLIHIWPGNNFKVGDRVRITIEKLPRLAKQKGART